jgi:hypothetical protein
MTSNTYIIPKINSKMLITPICNSDSQSPIISTSLYNCFLTTQSLISHISLHDLEITYTDILRYIIPNYLLVSGIPGKNTFINKLVFKSVVYFDLVEIYNTHHIIDNKLAINSLHVGTNAEESKESLFSKHTIRYDGENHICLAQLNNVTYKQIRILKYNTISDMYNDAIESGIYGGIYTEYNKNISLQHGNYLFDKIKYKFENTFGIK